ncbi:hypothetical protein [Pseudomonas sp. AM8]|uniref:hypothetical protein n=1 Tax=Pseudomonas sp. AM8 TaxID=2983368 RepID=UPI002E81C7BC|nr:hypothetical protein [Pseudomonas sp. AM8]
MERLEFASDQPIPDEYLLELGRMTATWTRLEFGLNFVISRLMGFDRYDVRPVIAFAHANFQQRVEVFAALCDRMQANHSQLALYQSVLTKIKGAQKGRNKYAHNVITSDGSGKIFVTLITAKGSFKIKPETIYLNDIKEVTAKIVEAAHGLNSLIVQTQEVDLDPES